MLNAVDLLNPSASKILFRLMIPRKNSTVPALPRPVPDSLAATPATGFITDPELATFAAPKTASVENPNAS